MVGTRGIQALEQEQVEFSFMNGEDTRRTRTRTRFPLGQNREFSRMYSERLNLHKHMTNCTLFLYFPLLFSYFSPHHLNISLLRFAGMLL